jgi:hypothetical protein
MSAVEIVSVPAFAPAPADGVRSGMARQAAQTAATERSVPAVEAGRARGPALATTAARGPWALAPTPAAPPSTT